MNDASAISDVLAGRSRWGVAVGDALASLRAMPDGCVQCVVTSPPYYAIRDYGVDGQIGLEQSPEEFIGKLVDVFREVRRVLRADGTCWVNMGDTYANDPKSRRSVSGPGLQGGANQDCVPKSWRTGELKKKDLIGVPWMLAFALRADGWYLRSECIWFKSNVMPESVSDRPVRTHEQVFLLSKSPRYFYDAEAIKEPVSGTANSRGNGVNPKASSANRNRSKQNKSFSAAVAGLVDTRNKRTVWKIPVARFKGAHFATFPAQLVLPCVLAGTSEAGCCAACGSPICRVVKKVRRPTRPGENTKVKVPAGWDTAPGGHGREKRRDSAEVGNRDPERHVTTTETVGWEAGCKCDAGDSIGCVVLDPFAGSGTTLAVAVEHGRRAVGLELNQQYAEMIRERMRTVQPNLKEAAA